MRSLQAAILVLALGGCVPGDPGGHYELRGGQPVRDDGLRYVVAGPESTSLRLYGSWFTNSLTIEFELTNLSAEPVTVRAAMLRAFDRDGTEFERQGPPWTCRSRADADVVLQRQDTCRIRARYQSRIKKMERVTVLHDGILREGRVLPIKLTLDES